MLWLDEKLMRGNNGWRWGLIPSPFIGLGFLIFLILFLDDPIRGEAEGANVRQTNYWEDIKELCKM